MLWTKCLCLPSNLYIEALNPDGTVFGVKACEEMIKVRQGHKDGVLSQWGWPDKERERHRAHCLLPCEDAMRRWLSTARESLVGTE